MLADELIQKSLKMLKREPYGDPAERHRLVRELESYLAEFAGIAVDPEPIINEDGEIYYRERYPAEPRKHQDDAVPVNQWTQRQDAIAAEFIRQIRNGPADETPMLLNTLRAFQSSARLREAIDELMTFSSAERFVRQIQNTDVERRIVEWNKRNRS